MSSSREQEQGSLYRRIAEDLKTAIDSGAYAAGGSLPSENDLAERYGASRGTGVMKGSFRAIFALKDPFMTLPGT